MTVTRRMDDLGRIVIPKEIREAMQLKEGEALDVSNTYDGKIILEKTQCVSLDNEPIFNIPKGRKMYIIRFEGCAGEVALLTEDQIRLLKWLGNNDYLCEDVHYEEYSEKRIEVI